MVDKLKEKEVDFGINSVRIQSPAGDYLDINNLGEMAVEVKNASFDVQFTAAQDVNATITGTPNVAFASAQDVNIANTPNVAFASAQEVVFPSAQTVTVDNATLQVEFASAQDVNIASSGTLDVDVTTALLTMQIDGADTAVGKINVNSAYNSAYIYKYNSTPIFYNSGVDATVYTNTSGNWEEEKNYGTFNGTTYDSGLATSATATVTGEIRENISTSNSVYVRLKVDGSVVDTFESDEADTSWYPFTLTGEFPLDDSSVPITIESNGDAAGKCELKNLNLFLTYNYTSAQLVTADFGATKTYLNSVTLPVSASIRLNNSYEQLISNETAAEVNIKFEIPIEFSQVDFVSGNSTVKVVGNT